MNLQRLQSQKCLQRFFSGRADHKDSLLKKASAAFISGSHLKWNTKALHIYVYGLLPQMYVYGFPLKSSLIRVAVPDYLSKIAHVLLLHLSLISFSTSCLFVFWLTPLECKLYENRPYFYSLINDTHLDEYLSHKYLVNTCWVNGYLLMFQSTHMIFLLLTVPLVCTRREIYYFKTYGSKNYFNNLLENPYQGDDKGCHWYF